MKKILFLSVLLMAVLVSGPVHSAELEPEGTPLRKLQRGFLNAMLSPFELSNELHQEKKEDTFPPSWFRGAGRGMLFMAGRALTGVVEMGTFFLPFPENYEPILYPEFPWELLEEEPEIDADGVAATPAPPIDRESAMTAETQKFELTAAGFDPDLAARLELTE